MLICAFFDQKSIHRIFLPFCLLEESSTRQLTQRTKSDEEIKEILKRSGEEHNSTEVLDSATRVSKAH